MVLFSRLARFTAPHTGIVYTKVFDEFSRYVCIPAAAAVEFVHQKLRREGGRVFDVNSLRRLSLTEESLKWLEKNAQCPNLFKNGQVIHVICMLHIKPIQHFLDNLTCLQSYLVPFLIHLENWRFFQITNFSCQNSKKWAIIKTFLLIIRFWRNLVRL